MSERDGHVERNVAHRETSEALGAYVLDALPGDEHLRVERHLAACDRCRDEESRLRLAAERLPSAATPLRPPPELKDRIMAAVRAEAEALQEAGSDPDRVSAPEPARRRFALSLRRPVVAGAAAAALASAAVAGFVLGGGRDQGPERTVSARVVGATAGPSARASLRRSGDRGTLVVSGLPDPPPNHIYQLWVKRTGQPPEPAGASFALRAGQVKVPRSLQGVESVLVTTEPAGGSTSPTRSPFIIARIA